MNEKSVSRLFVDMDGTLAEFTPVEKIEELYEEGYFRNLAAQHNVVEAVRLLINEPSIDVYILSACLDSEYACKEKNEWLNKYLPEIDEEHRIFTPYGEDKCSFIPVPPPLNKSDVLLDDYTVNLLDWDKKATGIKLLNGINDHRKTWQGQRIDYSQNPVLIANELIEVLNTSISQQKNNVIADYCNEKNSNEPNIDEQEK